MQKTAHPRQERPQDLPLPLAFPSRASDESQRDLAINLQQIFHPQIQGQGEVFLRLPSPTVVASCLPRGGIFHQLRPSTGSLGERKYTIQNATVDDEHDRHRRQLHSCKCKRCGDSTFHSTTSSYHRDVEGALQISSTTNETTTNNSQRAAGGYVEEV